MKLHNKLLLLFLCSICSSGMRANIFDYKYCPKFIGENSIEGYVEFEIPIYQDRYLLTELTNGGTFYIQYEGEDEIEELLTGLYSFPSQILQVRNTSKDERLVMFEEDVDRMCNTINLPLKRTDNQSQFFCHIDNSGTYYMTVRFYPKQWKDFRISYKVWIKEKSFGVSERNGYVLGGDNDNYYTITQSDRGSCMKIWLTLRVN